jgi:hypothetical protein
MATGQRETVEFDPNVTQRIALKYQTGRVVNGRNGNRVMFTTADDKVFFLDEDVAQLIYDLGLKPRAPFTVCRRQSGKAVAWEVSRLGEQPDGTFAVERLPATKTNGRQAWNGNAPPPTWDELAAAEPAPAPLSREQQARAATPFWSDKDVQPAPAPEAPSLLERQLDASIAEIQKRKAGACIVSPVPVAPPANGSAPPRPVTKLESALRTAVAAAFAASEYAKSIGYEAMPRFTSEDISKLAMTALIENGGRR